MVDVDLSGCGASGDRSNSNSSSRRRMLEVPDSDCPEIVPLELYDSSRAKIAANLSWIFSKAYGIDNIPEDLRDAFYTDQYDQEHIKPPVIKLLLSSELYCRVCSLILKGDQVAALQGHQPVIHALSRKGIYVMESDDMPVSESDLTQSPIKMNAHMALIDALMMAYTVEMISIEKVVASVKRFSTFSASKELPYDLEDAMVFWINKVNLKMREITERELKLKQQLLESSSQQKVRYRRDHPLNKQLPFFPLMEDLMRDVCDGCSLLAIIHYYCPELMKLEDICLKEVTSIADSLYNIQLLIDFSHQYLNKCFYLTLEDMLYAPLVLKPNAMVFIAELFWWFEIVKPDFVQPRDVQEVKDAKSLLQQKSTRPPLPISNATKRSFMVSPANGPSDPQTPVPQITADIGIRYYLHPEEFVKGSPAFNAPHPLLPLRQRQYKSSLPGEESPDTRHRSNSLTRVDGQPRGSVLAWQEKKPRPLSQPTPFALHYATDGDPDVGSGDSISLARSISKDSLASNVINVTPKHQSQLMPPIRSNGKALLRNVDMEDEDDEELIAIIKSDEGLVNNSDLEIQSVLSRAASTSTLTSPKKQPNDLEAANQDDSFFLEPLMPAVMKPAKESLVLVNKREECGEEKHRSASARRTADGLLPSARKKASNANADADINRTFTPIVSSEFTASVEPDTADPLQHSEASEASLSGFRPLLSSSIDTSAQGEAGGFFLHTGDPEEESASKLANGTKSTGTNKASATDTTWTLNMQDSDSEMLDMEEGEGDLPPEDEIHPVRSRYSGEEESSKLHYDMRVKEREDKEGASGRSSPCLSTISQTSSISLASTSVRMTNFAERKLQRLNSVETKSSTSSSQKSTPDGSECCPLPMITWRQRREKSPNRQIKDSAHLLASELVQLHMQLEEKRRAIEGQKKKMEALSARQRLKLGRAAFLHIVKKGKNEGIPQPLKPEHFLKESNKPNAEETVAIVSRGSRTENALASQEDKDEYSKQMEGVETKDVNEKIIENDIQESIAAVRQRWLKDSLQPPYDVGKNKASPNGGLEDGLGDVDVNEYSRSIEKLNETLSNLQHEMHKLSQQQELLMKFKDQAPSTPSPDASCTPPDQKTKQITHLVESPMSMGGGPAQGARKQSRSTPAKNARSARPTDIKLSRDSKTQSTFRVITPTHSVETLPHLRPFTSSKAAKPETEAIASDDHVSTGASEASPDRVPAEQTTERRKDDAAVDILCEEGNQRATVLSTSQKDSYNYFYQQINTEAVISTPKKTEHPSINSSDCSGKENIPVEEQSKNKANLIEVDISELNGPEDGEACENRGISTSQVISESEQKSGLGFFFKDDQKAEDELAKKRAAFLLKQQRKAEEARFRRQQLEAEIEQKRDEARRKGEEERVRKEEEKARRELIKQEYLRRKQQQILDEQGLGKPKPKTKKQRPRSVHREESSSEPPSRYPSTPDNLSSAQSGSSLSLASAATTEAESVNSGGGGSGGFSQRTDSMETFSVLSRNQSRNTERDWENTSTASSIASVAEYTGPKLFKEPSSKSNKPLIHNAVSHCCLAGKVNEPMKNSILEELERCEAHHYIILFRDAGCQFRALYAYFPEAEEIQKLTGTGPKSITKKMIDKIYKYSSDRKQFNLIPSKTMSVSVDALTIHNHLWQAKRTGVPKKQTVAK